MKQYPQDAYDYLESEHIRLLIKEHGEERVPTIEERVMEAFVAGRNSVKFPNWYEFANKDIIFPYNAQ